MDGGGHGARTLATIRPRELAGVGPPRTLIPTIRPMPWDVPMTVAVLGDGTLRGP